MADAYPVHTVGHSTRTFDDVLAMLQTHDITTLVDVRSFPSSRKYPQWNQATIVDALPPEISYHWPRELGGRRHTPANQASVNDAWDVKAFRDYADYMASDEFRSGLDKLIKLARRERVAIMCSEAVPWRCHRRLITDALIVAGVHVVHILSRTSSKRGTLTPFAHVRQQTITYPKRADTDVAARVTQSVREIPSGRVASYGDIGRELGLTPRQVGRAMSRLDEQAPWWRVVYADGTPASCHDGIAPTLLAAEHTPMSGSKVDMRRAREPATSSRRLSPPAPRGPEDR